MRIERHSVGHSVEVGTQVTLASEIELRGLPGACLRLPAIAVLRRVQRQILMGIRANAERGAARRV